MTRLRAFSLATMAALVISLALGAAASAQEDASPPPPDPCCPKEDPE